MALVAFITAAGCGQGAPQKCEVAKAQGFECLERHRGKSDRQMLLGCFPFSPPERITGAWVHGFETNEFYEGDTASRELINRAVGDTQLEVDGSEQLGARLRVFQIDFVGRRSQCDMGFPRNIILVDRVSSRRELVGQ